MKRAKVEVNGIVQGVGFRPFIHKLVKEYNMKGWVKNSSTGVIMELEGYDKDLSNFIMNIERKKPKLAVIEKISTEFLEEIKGYSDFKIVKSTNEEERFTLISPDVCICEDCLEELFDKKNRRCGFPFINCTNCGPRFTIIQDIPYDRNKTTMRDFPMCESCEDEYGDIEDRRYHAQPDCCHECGPKLFFLDGEGKEVEGDPVLTAQRYLSSGLIVAVKGLGGFHLACDATKPSSVAELRRRKNRDEKPFALMCRDFETVQKWCEIKSEEREHLEGFRRPIVLLKKKNDHLNYISLDNDYYGVMLPYTPLHYLLLQGEQDTLVMTSGNISDMPILSDNEEALIALKGVADGFLMNNRDINTKCDDSLIRVVEGREYPIRRSRGYAPFPIKLSQGKGNILACGAEQKASFALSKDEYVFLSQHIGDLKNLETLEHYEAQIKNFQRLFGIVPSALACDLHPDYISTQYALNRSREEEIPLYFVQHHHAHMASCMMDNNLEKDVIGIIWDGTGYGIDGGIWGGEFLVGGYKKFERRGSIHEIELPGGDRAIKEIDRIGLALLFKSLGGIPDGFKTKPEHNIIEDMLIKDINCPKASSIGRLFDGVAALTGLKSKASYEGQGAILMESRAGVSTEGYTYGIEVINGVFTFNWRPMIKKIIEDLEEGKGIDIISARFMNTLVNMAIEITESISRDNGVRDVVLSGGVFQNLYLLHRIKEGLKKGGFRVFVHNKVSTSDEGISVGQAAVVQRGGGLRCV